MALKVLIVDDEPSILATIAPLLRSRGYAVSTALTATAALAAMELHSPDLVVLDLGLPDMDGVDLCRMIRQAGGTPIIVLSARGAEVEKVNALDAGADDYVTKPFGREELLARMRVALRRADPWRASGDMIVCGPLTIDRNRHRVVHDGVELRLTPKEFDLLVLFTQHPGRVLAHRTILRAIWGAHAVNQPEHLRVLVAALRKKIERDPTRPRLIITEPWVGYRFALSEDGTPPSGSERPQ